MDIRRVEEPEKVTKDPIINEGMPINLKVFDGVHKYKSVRRAIRKGYVTPWGTVAPRRPFNNRSRKKGTRPLEIEKERIYEQLKYRKSA